MARRPLDALQTGSDEREVQRPADATHPLITPAPSSSSPVSSTAVSAPEATPRSSTFHFVNVEGPRTEYRSAARAHVMRRVNKERDEARRYNDTVSRDMRPIRIASAVDLFRTVDMKHFDHYMQSFAKSILPMDSTEQTWWARNALDDEACNHSMRYASQAHQAVLAGRDFNLDVDCCFHKGEALKHINRRLSTLVEPPDDALVLAIACLAAHENIFGSREISTAHTSGLVAIQDLRGGFHGTSTRQFLERLVQWVELSHATAQRKKPKFVSLEMLTPNALEIVCATPAVSVESTDNLRLNSSMITSHAPKGMNATMAVVFHRLYLLANICNRVKSINDLDTDSLYAFTTEALLLELHINTILNKESKLDCSKPEDCLPLYGASLVFIYAVLRGIPVSSPVLDNFIVRIKTSLDRTGFDAFCQHFSSELLLWLLLLMTWITHGRPDRPWFHAATRWLVWQLDLFQWEQTKGVLAQYPMVDAVCENPFQKIFNELDHQA